MSFLKRLFGGRSAAERVARGEQLVAQQELAQARVEFESALATDELDAATRARVQSQLDAACDGLAQARLQDARNLLESGEEKDAADALDLARTLARSPSLLRQIDDLTAAKASRVVADADDDEYLEHDGDDIAEDDSGDDSGDDDSCAGSDAQACSAGNSCGAVTVGAVEGDDEMSSVELALMMFGEADADRLRGLIAVDPAVADALAAAHDGDVKAARAHWSRTREPSCSDALVRRESARAALIDGDFDDAVARLGGLSPADAEGRELLMEALVGAGRVEAAADVAAELLARGQAMEPLVAIGALADAGRVESSFEWVDRLLDARGDDVKLWALRASLCERMDNMAGMEEADQRAFELYRRQCGSCSGAPQFPLQSARRYAERVIRAGEGHGRSRAELDDLLRVMVAADVEQRGRWRKLLNRK